MPFTPVHPFLILPFLRISKHPFVIACFVFGSMAPDIPYYLFVRFISGGHEFPECFLIGVPFTVAFVFLWYMFIQTAFINALPIKNKIENKKITYKTLIAGGLAAGLGIFSHLAVDSFTHATGGMVQLLPILEVKLMNGSIPLYNFLQFFLTMVGFGILGLYGFYKLEYKTITREQKRFWLRVVVFSFLAMIPISLVRYELFVYPSIILLALMAAASYGIIFASLIKK